MRTFFLNEFSIEIQKGKKNGLMLHRSLFGSSCLNFCYYVLLCLSSGHCVVLVCVFTFYSSHGFNSSPQIRQRAWTVEELGFGAVLRGIGPEDIVP